MVRFCKKNRNKVKASCAAFLKGNNPVRIEIKHNRDVAPRLTPVYVETIGSVNITPCDDVQKTPVTAHRKGAGISGWKVFVAVGIVTAAGISLFNKMIARK